MLCVRAQVVPGRELQYYTLVALTDVERTGGGGDGAKARGRHWHANLLLNYQKVAVANSQTREKAFCSNIFGLAKTHEPSNENGAHTVRWFADFVICKYRSDWITTNFVTKSRYFLGGMVTVAPHAARGT